MEPFGQADSYETIIFFDEDGVTVSKEMMYAEFEAILDGVVGIGDVAGAERKAAYVVVTSQLEVRALVFFLIGFDNAGYADESWNIPLRHLSDVASLGPDLGGGPVRIACRSDCSIAWHREHLWDPDVEPGSETLENIRAAVERNRLALVVTAREQQQAPQYQPPPQYQQPPGYAAPQPGSVAQGAPAQPAPQAPPPAEPEEGGASSQIAALIRQQRQKLSRLNDQHAREIQELNTAHQDDLAAAEAEVQRLQDENREQSARFKKLQQQARADAQQVQELREQLEAALAEAPGKGPDVKALRKQVEEEFERRMEEKVAALQEQVETRAAEADYHKEMEVQLRADLQQLQEEKKALLTEGGGNVLEKLHKLGVVFVAYHPGVGHMPIAVKDVGSYMENPVGFVAMKSNVTEEHYTNWKKHWENPVCQGRNVDGSPCTNRVDRVEQPARYIHGKSNVCPSCQARGQGGARSGGLATS